MDCGEREPAAPEALMPLCGRFAQVMWVCAELGVDFEQHHGFAFRNDPWARKLNPKGTVPFIKDGGLVLNVRAPIAGYLLGGSRSCNALSVTASPDCSCAGEQHYHCIYRTQVRRWHFSIPEHP